MKKLKLIFTSLIFTFLILACSSDDSEEILPVEFDSVTVSKNLSFTDTPIVLDIIGNNYKNIEFVFSDNNMTFKKIDNTTYEISANKTAKGSVRVFLANGDDKESKSVNLEFLEHGVFNSRFVEGIEVDVDNTNRLLEVLGEPDGKIEYTSGTSVGWVYTLGVVFVVKNETNVISSAGINTYERTTNTVDGSVLSKAYPYLINEIFDFSDSGRGKMDVIVDELGLPTFTYTGTLPNPLTSFKNELRAPTGTDRGLYQYVYFNDNNNSKYSMGISFFSNDIDDYTGESISSISII